MEATFILALFAHGYKVKTTTLFHLLKGKRTSSVLIYGFCYDCLRFIEAWPLVTENTYQQAINFLSAQGFLTYHLETKEGQITHRGQRYLLNHNFSLNTYAFINQYLFGKNTSEIWRMIQFCVQVVSNLSYDAKNYLPLESSPLYQQHLKHWLTLYSKDELIHQVRQEWLQLFRQLTNEESNYLAAQLTGHECLGKTAQQLHKPGGTEFEKEMWQKNTLHHLLQVIMSESNPQPLYNLIQPLVAQNQNQSMQTTYSFLHAGLTPGEVAHQRKIKVSTVKDHLLELAIRRQIDSFYYVKNQTVRHSLTSSASDPATWQFKKWQATIPNLDYLDFRLCQIGLLWKRRDK
ncbi:helix-turn-helix domain-containing protein [Enterococcus faecalis]